MDTQTNIDEEMSDISLSLSNLSVHDRSSNLKVWCRLLKITPQDFVEMSDEELKFRLNNLKGRLQLKIAKRLITHQLEQLRALVKMNGGGIPINNDTRLKGGRGQYEITGELDPPRNMNNHNIWDILHHAAIEVDEIYKNQNIKQESDSSVFALPHSDDTFENNYDDNYDYDENYSAYDSDNEDEKYATTTDKYTPHKVSNFTNIASGSMLMQQNFEPFVPSNFESIPLSRHAARRPQYLRGGYDNLTQSYTQIQQENDQSYNQRAPKIRQRFTYVPPPPASTRALKKNNLTHRQTSNTVSKSSPKTRNYRLVNLIKNKKSMPGKLYKHVNKKNGEVTWRFYPIYENQVQMNETIEKPVPDNTTRLRQELYPKLEEQFYYYP